MRIEITKDFRSYLEGQVRCISKDKPEAARKFKSDLIKKFRKDLKYPYLFTKGRFILQMTTSEIMFLKATLLFILLM